MKRSEAVKILIADFHNNLVAQGYADIDDIEDSIDREVAKALKIKLEV